MNSPRRPERGRSGRRVGSEKGKRPQETPSTAAPGAPDDSRTRVSESSTAKTPQPSARTPLKAASSRTPPRPQPVEDGKAVEEESEEVKTPEDQIEEGSYGWWEGRQKVRRRTGGRTT